MNNIPREFTGKYIGEIGYDEEAGDLKITIKMDEPIPESKEQQEVPASPSAEEINDLEERFLKEILTHTKTSRLFEGSEPPFFPTPDFEVVGQMAAAKACAAIAEQSLSSPKEEISYKPEFYEYMIKYYPHLCETEKDREISSLRQQEKEKDELIKVQTEYISFLNEGAKGPETLAYIHGFRHPEAGIEKGKEFRSRIDKLKLQLKL